MSREQAQIIINEIENRGFQAYLVGGCVRDLLLGRIPEDWHARSRLWKFSGTRHIPQALNTERLR